MGMRENPLALELILCRRSECLGRLQDHRDVGVLAHVQAVIRRYIRTRMYINVRFAHSMLSMPMTNIGRYE